MKQHSFVKVLFYLSFSVLIILNASAFSADEAVLFNWNEGSGTSWSGWTWSDDVAFGHPGWTKDNEVNYRWGYGPRCFELGGYGSDNLAKIDTTDRAPSTDSGGSFKIYETGVPDTTHLCTWWLWYDGQPLGARNIANSSTNRWGFYLKVNGMEAIKDDGGLESVPNANFHVGTYLCWDTGEPSYSQGNGCPYEGPGNQHYYHYLTINPGTWIHVVLDNHPTHRRGEIVLGNDPSFIESGKHYLEHLMRFYFEIIKPQEQATNMYIDEMTFFKSTQPENEESITSTWVGYWPETDYWEIGWKDMSFSATEELSDYSNSTFEIRWSTSPITNENYSSATQVEPLLYTGEAYCGPDSVNLISRPHPGAVNAWTRFKLPDDIEKNHKQIFFAIKDVSVKGEHIGTIWPYKKGGDWHDAPSPYIRTIDYHLAPTSGESQPVDLLQPTNLKVVQ